MFEAAIEDLIGVVQPEAFMLMCLGVLIGSLVGFLPGLGSSVADWFAYAHAVQTEKNRQNFGKDDVRGVIASEGCNNAKEGGHYIPTLAFGIPGGASSALVLTAFIAVGIKPGPDMLTSQLNLTFAVIWTLVIANIIATAICMVFAKSIAKICFMPFYAIMPPVVAFVFIGAFAANFHAYDLTGLMIFSSLGFFMRRYGWPRAPLVIGMVLGDKMELYLRLSYTRYGLEWLTRPTVMILIALLILSIAYPLLGDFFTASTITC
ncbi:MAG: tripartite tricarboxylate transporter permease [Deltaproteobacteria bacterium]|nr:tripartite tricarboxylate transporter permease [Deltaproteobacteria bacterium]